MANGKSGHESNRAGSGQIDKQDLSSLGVTIASAHGVELRGMLSAQPGKQTNVIDRAEIRNKPAKRRMAAQDSG
jgi:hypothetical protein